MSKSSEKTLYIGILAMSLASEYHRQIAGMTQHYMKLANEFGEVRMVTPDQSPEEMKIDLLILPGGPDLSLALRDDMNSAAWIGQGKDQPYYTMFYKHNLQRWIDAGVPMLGICLGSQALANHFGVKIMTDGHGHQIKDEHRSLRIEDKEVGLSTSLIEVNSRHHQFIDAGKSFQNSSLVPLVYGADHPSRLRVPKGMSFTKRAKELAYQAGEAEGFTPSHIEAFRHESLPIAGVQWHPEDMIYGINEHGDPTTHQIINWLLSERKPVTNGELKPQASTLSA
jgi:GMP synthase-like glutamine amidotransferase